MIDEDFLEEREKKYSPMVVALGTVDLWFGVKKKYYQENII